MRRLFLAGALMVLSCQLAYADEQVPRKHWYVSGFVGLNALADQHDMRTTVTSVGTAHVPLNIDWKHGPVYQLSVGYQRFAPLVFEVEFSHAVNKSRGVQIISVGSTLQNSASISTTNIMFNVLHEFKNDWIVKPFVGAGLGAARVAFDYADGLGSGEKTRWAFAMQPIAGMKWNVWRDLDLVALYKFVYIPDQNITETHSHGTTTNSHNLDQYMGHSFLLGARYNF
jgi:opacity protein-like surface antigen